MMFPRISANGEPKQMIADGDSLSSMASYPRMKAGLFLLQPIIPTATTEFFSIPSKQKSQLFLFSHICPDAYTRR